jgi:tetratricopeptide (TPR) repeat protein
MNKQVKAWQETVVIPTYEIGKPEKNPMFLEKRVYQGSSGVVYPHPVVEKIFDEKTDKEYKSVFLENEYIRVMILPELGGRIQMAFDKIKQRHFIYYNQVIKPALVGLTGPWISGGIEFNWPQHHRPSTFEPVDFTIAENADGSKTVWINEVERMFRTKGMAGFTLYPGKAYIEISGKLYNRTPFPQTFLWWANPAVKVNDHYQSVFPPDVHAVYDHGKRDVSSFPIAKGVYYKIDYSPGTDISCYKNIPVPTSYMAVSSKYNFIGGYEHDTKGGLLHVANHHFAPGKKQWTWGFADFGRAWDRNLTDEDGPYIELMTGVFTDNQPDFSWLQPYEQKTFEQYFMPYSEVGMVKNATKEAAVNLEMKDETVTVKLYVTAAYDIELRLMNNENLLFGKTISLNPETPFTQEIALEKNINPDELTIEVKDVKTGKILVNYCSKEEADGEMPQPATAVKKPGETENNEQLYLTGLHLEQYRHATYLATDYYEEALRRDPGDYRANNAMGLWFLRRGKFAVAEPYFKKAIATITKRNPNPYDGEAYYNLGWSLMLQGKHATAYDAFYKSIWNDAWQHAGFLNLARIATLQHSYEEALYLVQKSLIKNYHSHTAWHLKSALLRKLDKKQEALACIEEALDIDPFNFGCLFEKYLLTQEKGNNENGALDELKKLSRNWVHNYIEYAIDYVHAGLYPEATQLLHIYESVDENKHTLIPYYLGWIYSRSGNDDKAISYFKKGAGLSPDYIFPNRIEEVLMFEKAIETNPSDANAYHFLGNFWYDKKQYNDAIACWEKSVELNPAFPTAQRNLAIALYNKRGDADKSLQYLQKAFELDTSDARVLMELDQLRKRLNIPHEQRFQLLNSYDDLVTSRDDLYLEKITLHNQTGNFETARKAIAACQFHPWEGGEGKVVSQYLLCHTELAKQAIYKGDHATALKLLNEAVNYPPNLGEGKLPGAQENDIYYWKGVAYELSGNKALADEHFKEATKGISEPVQAVFYNDPQPDKIFYQAMAWRKLGNKEKATEILQRLISFGDAHLNDHISIDYFAVSLPDLLVFDADLDLRNKIHCLYLKALGNLGLGGSHINTALALFDEVLQSDINHQGALVHKALAGYLTTMDT